MTRALVALACLVAASIAWAVSAPRAGATEDVTTQRLAGANRYATAAGAALSAYPDGAAIVVLASGEAFPDALAGAAIAGALDGPLVLTTRAELAPEAREAIEQLGADGVVILGGPGAVSEAIERDLGAELDVTRVSGADRYATAAEAARAIGAGSIASHGGLRTAIVASGTSFADALAGGGIANRGDGTPSVHPVLLVDDSVPAPTASAIDELDIEQVIILGGSAAVSDAVETELAALTGNPAVRIAGANRYATGVAVAEAMVSDFGSPATAVLLASGERFADALAGGVLSGRAGAPVLLTPQVALATEAEDFLVRRSSTVRQIVALGGTNAVSASALEQAEAAAETAPEEEAAAEDAGDSSIAVTPTGSSSLSNTSSRSFTASGLTDLDEVDIVLLPCANISSTSSGHAFRNTNTNTVADGGAEGGAAPDRASTVASIASVNGAAQNLANNDYADDVVPEDDGTVTFSVSGPSSATAAGGCVRPVVFDDADGDSTLDTTTANPSTGSEDLGLGGPTTFNPQSGGGSGGGGGSTTPQLTDYGTRNVTRHAVDEGSNDAIFEACKFLQGSGNSQVEHVDYSECDVFRYDTDDTFRRGSTSLTFAQFETYLTAGDDITIKLCRSTTVVCASSFTLIDESPGSPTDVAATADADGVTVSFREPASTFRPPSDDEDGSAYYLQSLQAADSYRLYRRAVASTEACPTALDRYGRVENATGGTPRGADAPNEIADPDPPAGRSCYVVVAEQDFDESAPSTPDDVTVSDGSTSTTLPVVDGIVGTVEEATSSSTTP